MQIQGKLINRKQVASLFNISKRDDTILDKYHFHKYCNDYPRLCHAFLTHK